MMTNELPTLRAGLVGIGAMGRHHARVLREMSGVDLVAVADSQGDRFGAAGGVPVLPDIASLISEGIDIAIVALPTQFHLEAALELAEAKIHTLVEKPIASSVAEGEQMLHAFESRGIVGAVGHIERFNPALQQLRRRLERGDLGEVYQIVTRRQGPFPARIADVGVGKDLASHDIDLTAWVAQSDYRSIYGQVTRRSGREHEDMVLATGQLANGVIVNHTVNWLSPMKERTTVVTGEKGAFVADTANGDLTFFANGTILLEWDSVQAFRGVSEGDMTRFAFAKREPLRTELEAFRDAVHGLESDTVSMAEGLRTLAVVEGMLQSAQTGQPVTFTP
ncbi:Predicted dehydrogenase [Micrococcales bacterium KH10]|nr:Predicted dehydrogenase [Micrococcales bacterium KH10]